MAIITTAKHKNGKDNLGKHSFSFRLTTYFDVGALFLQFAGDACDCPPCACSCHQHVQFTCWEGVSYQSEVVYST